MANGYQVRITDDHGNPCGLLRESVTCYDEVRDCSKCILRKGHCRRSDCQMLCCNVTFILPGGIEITAKKGFIYDGASIPKRLLGIVGGGKYDVNWEFGAIFHDLIFKSQPQIVFDPDLIIDHDWANEHFDHIMKYYDKCPTWKRTKVMIGLWIGSESAWDENESDACHYKKFVEIKHHGVELVID